MSLDLLLGYTGLPRLATPASSASRRMVWASCRRRIAGLLESIAGGLLVGTALAALFGLIVSHVRDVYFLMITLALGMVLWGLSLPLDSGDRRRQRHLAAFPRSSALVGCRRRARFPSTTWRCSSSRCRAWRWLLVRSPFGLTLRGIRENEGPHEEPGLQHLAALLSELRVSPARLPAWLA